MRSTKLSVQTEQPSTGQLLFIRTRVLIVKWKRLVADMEAGRVGAVIVYGVNPAYEYYDGEAFAKRLKQVKVSVSLNERTDETTELVNMSFLHIISLKAGAMLNQNRLYQYDAAYHQPIVSNQAIPGYIVEMEW